MQAGIFTALGKVFNRTSWRGTSANEMLGNAFQCNAFESSFDHNTSKEDLINTFPRAVKMSACS